MLSRNSFIQVLAAALLATVASSSTALAEDDDEGFRVSSKYGRYGGENRGKPVQPAHVNAKFRQECSECHVAYAPGLLPAESWRKIMAGLDQHFGSDASLAEEDNREITEFLVNNASNRWQAPTAPLRITESGWFKHKHDSREIAPAVWNRPAVKTPANCAACHPDAGRGDFRERNIRIPK